MKVRKSILKAYTLEQIKEMGSRGCRKIVDSYERTTGHDMEQMVNVAGTRNVEIALKHILCELDAYDKETKTATEIKSYHGSKIIALYRAYEAATLIYYIQELSGCRKIKSYKVVGVNSNITKYGLDATEATYTLEQFRKHEIPKIRGMIRNQEDINTMFNTARSLAVYLIKKSNLLQ